MCRHCIAHAIVVLLICVCLQSRAHDRISNNIYYYIETHKHSFWFEFCFIFIPGLLCVWREKKESPCFLFSDYAFNEARLYWSMHKNEIQADDPKNCTAHEWWHQTIESFSSVVWLAFLSPPPSVFFLSLSLAHRYIALLRSTVSVYS